MRYRLTASLDGDSQAVIFSDHDSVGATFTATREILDHTYADMRGPWALGRVELRDADGRLLRLWRRSAPLPNDI
jgi:hypothetical protein